MQVSTMSSSRRSVSAEESESFEDGGAEIVPSPSEGKPKGNVFLLL